MNNWFKISGLNAGWMFVVVAVKAGIAAVFN